MRIAIIVSTVGYHWEELFGAWDELERAGAVIDIFTVDGSMPRPDPMSLKHTGPLTLIGLGVPERIDPSTPRGQEALHALEGRRHVAQLEAPSYDAVYLPGGHGCLFDVNRNADLHGKLLELYRGGKILSAVCHATSTFALVKDGGRSIAAGKALTGFPQALDDILVPAHAVDPRFVPLPFSNEEVLRQEGVNVPVLDALRGTLNPRHMCVSLPFITGVGPKSARPVARALLSTLTERLHVRVAA